MGVDEDVGRGAGANVSVITKSGTNEYHGTIFEFLRNDVLNANNWANEPAARAIWPPLPGRISIL